MYSITLKFNTLIVATTSRAYFRGSAERILATTGVNKYCVPAC